MCSITDIKYKGIITTTSRIKFCRKMLMEQWMKQHQITRKMFDIRCNRISSSLAPSVYYYAPIFYDDKNCYFPQKK